MASSPRHHRFRPEVFRAVGTVPVERLLSGVFVRDVMSSRVISVTSGKSLNEAAQVILENRLGSLPVVDHNRLVDIPTETDLLRHIVGANACCSEVEAIVVS